MTSPANPRPAVAAALLGVIDGELSTDADGDQTFGRDGISGFVQYGRLGDAVALLTVTCIAALSVPQSASLDRLLVAHGAQSLLGSVIAVPAADGSSDILVRYCLPWAGLDADALRAILLPVLAAAADLRAALAAAPPP